MRIACAAPRLLVSCWTLCSVAGCSDSESRGEVGATEALMTETFEFDATGGTYLRDGSPNQNQGDETFQVPCSTTLAG